MTTDASLLAPDASNEYKDRVAKLDALREKGIHPYPERFDRTHMIEDVVDLGKDKSNIIETETATKRQDAPIRICGRMMSYRSHGKLSFAQVQDFSGRMQVCFMRDVLGEETYKTLKLFDVADHVGVAGELIVTQHGEVTLLVKEVQMLSKALRPLPEKWHGLSDQETKYRQRYLELTSDREAMDRFMLRTRVIKEIRTFLEDNNFVEIETPVLQTQASGAVAKPFATHHNALDIEAYLRIAPETYLKRAIVGGFDRVFEFAKCFRNEGMDPSHLQEFTMLEYYGAYWNYEDNMDFTEKMFTYMLQRIFNTLKIEIQDPEGKTETIDFTAPWPRLSYREIIKNDSGIDINEHDSKESLEAAIKAANLDLEYDPNISRGNLIDVLYKKVSRPKLIQPCFVIKHPADTKPLARQNDDDENVCDTFQLLVNTWEIINAYSEIIDPLDQRGRFIQQSEAKAAGDEEAMDMDEDYLRAMEHGMPPNSGWGMGIDRLVALLSKSPNLRDVVLFPFMKPEQKMQQQAPQENQEQQEQPQQAASNDSPLVAGISWDDACKLADQYAERTRTHLYMAAAAMAGLADHFGISEEEKESWKVAGLLHDLDWDMVEMDADRHCGEELEKILKDAGGTDDLFKTIQSHYEAKGVPRNTLARKCLYAADELTGFIVAVTLVRPSKQMGDVKLKSIKKKLKDKSFAAGVEREHMKTCEPELGIELDAFITLVLESMKKEAPNFGM